MPEAVQGLRTIGARGWNITMPGKKTPTVGLHPLSIVLDDMIDIFTQMTKGRKFEEDYLKNKMRW